MVFVYAWRAVVALWRSPATRGLVATAALVWGSGVVFYRFVEDLSWVDAAYFTIVTLTTVGYGDISPQTTAGKLFTAAYLVIGIGLFVAFLGEVARIAPTLRGGKDAA
jgi:voltage-gated potassium channel Kch